MSRRPALLAALALGGCTDTITVKPVIEIPVGDTDAEAFAALDEIEITIAREGDSRDLVTDTFARGEPLELTGIPFGDDLVIHMTGYVGDTVVGYGRTCAFQVGANRAPAAPHVFFSRTVKFASLATTPAARIDGRAASFLGSALLVGGHLGADPVLDVERFDPATGELTIVGRVSERLGAVHAQIGTTQPLVAVIGGYIDSGPTSEGAKFIELLDGERSVEETTTISTARIGLTATSLTDGRVMVMGGKPPLGTPVGAITELAMNGPDLDVRDLRAVLAHPRTDHTATRLGDDVGAPILIAGGVDGASAPVGIAELFKPLREELANPATFAPTMVVPRSRHHAARMPDGSVLIIGGVTANDMPARTLELFSVDAGFIAVGELPQTAGIVDMSVTPLPDGRVLIAGGRTTVGGAATNTAYIARLDPLDGSVDVVATDRLAIPRAGHHAALLCDGTVLISGGTPVAEVAERYNPPPTGRR